MNSQRITIVAAAIVDRLMKGSTLEEKNGATNAIGGHLWEAVSLAPSRAELAWNFDATKAAELLNEACVQGRAAFPASTVADMDEIVRLAVAFPYRKGLSDSTFRILSQARALLSAP